jgi:hypothetical protein
MIKCPRCSGYPVVPPNSLRVALLDGRSSFGVPLEMRIGNDTPALHTTHLPGFVFLFRDAIGDQALMSTDTGPVD